MFNGKKLSVYIDEEDHEVIKKLADDYNRSISKQIHYMIKDELEKYKVNHKEKQPQR